ncbi:MAG TPA: response regulator [Candidatus Aminicenantes bacterium]|nr:response regulator [Candidatus Aminicenantes bacterium]
MGEGFDTMRKRILVTDDEPNMLSAISYVLEAAGYDVLLSDNGRQALDTILAQQHNHQSIDLLITDILMFEMSGLELIEQFRLAFPETPILVITGFGSQGLKSQLLKRKGVGYLEKPFRPQTLLERVDELLKGQPVAEGVPEGAGTDPEERP